MPIEAVATNGMLYGSQRHGTFEESVGNGQQLLTNTLWEDPVAQETPCIAHGPTGEVVTASETVGPDVSRPQILN